VLLVLESQNPKFPTTKIFHSCATIHYEVCIHMARGNAAEFRESDCAFHFPANRKFMCRAREPLFGFVWRCTSGWEAEKCQVRANAKFVPQHFSPHPVSAHVPVLFGDSAARQGVNLPGRSHIFGRHVQRKSRNSGEDNDYLLAGMSLKLFLFCSRSDYEPDLWRKSGRAMLTNPCFQKKQNKPGKKEIPVHVQE
jgi:hypothetical protein